MVVQCITQAPSNSSRHNSTLCASSAKPVTQDHEHRSQAHVTNTYTVATGGGQLTDYNSQSMDDTATETAQMESKPRTMYTGDSTNQKRKKKHKIK